MQQISICTEEIIKEIDNIYGLDKCKETIINYNTYINLNEQLNLGNYNILIRNKSQYNSYEKLVEILYKLLKANNIINNYKYLDNDYFQSNKDIDKKEKIEAELLIVDIEKINKPSRYIKEDVKDLIIKYPNKIFIVIEQIESERNNYTEIEGITWNMEINPISKENKINYINKTLQEHGITLNCNNTFTDVLSNEPYYKVKNEVLSVLVNCKAKGLTEINDRILQEDLNCKYCKQIKETKINKKALQELENLIGLEDVKNQIKQIVNYIKVNKRRGKLPMLHMCFMGNPGAGKTEVARIVGRIFAEEHILSDKEIFVEAQRSDLIAKYVGQTAIKTKEIIQRATGGVLFIDEAYSLIPTGGYDYANECISTLIKEMEDKRDNLCVIFAGYNKEMEELLESNTGFESRIQFKILFNDYTEEELYKIFKKMCKEDNYKLSNNIKKIIIEFFKQEKLNENFSNGRCVRNIFEKIKFEQAERIISTNEQDVNLIKVEDVKKAINKNSKMHKIKNKIGF